MRKPSLWMGKCSGAQAPLSSPLRTCWPFVPMRARKPCSRCAKAEKTNEIPIAKAVLPCLPNTPRVYTADALHTHAAFMQVVHDQHGFSLLTVKANQPLLFPALRLYFTDPAPPFWSPDKACTFTRRRGRPTKRRTLLP